MDKIRPQMKVHTVAPLRNGNEYIHMTLTTEKGVNYNIWVEKNELNVVRVDVSDPYEG